MVVERSRRNCVLCGAQFTGRSFLCPACSARYRRARPTPEERRRFYEGVDRLYPTWANTYGSYNPPLGLLRMLERLPHSVRILELGCGGGSLLRDLAARGYRELVGLDLARTALREARARETPAWLLAAEAERLPFQARSFDVVLSVDLIEHVEDLDSHLAEVARVLRPGGWYLLKTPNRPLAELYYRLAGLHDYRFWHPTLLSVTELRRALERYGFRVQFVPQPRLTPAQLRKIPSRFARALARRVPLRLLPAALRPHLEVVATLD